jgi:hypothetical protein
MNNADMPANPTSPNSSDPEWAAAVTGGLTKREHFAGLAMQAMITVDADNHLDEGTIAKIAVNLADALLTELDKVQQ